MIHEVLERVDRALVALVTEPDGMKELRAAVDLLTRHAAVAPVVRGARARRAAGPARLRLVRGHAEVDGDRDAGEGDRDAQDGVRAVPQDHRPEA